MSELNHDTCICYEGRCILMNGSVGGFRPVIRIQADPSVCDGNFMFDVTFSFRQDLEEKLLRFYQLYVMEYINTNSNDYAAPEWDLQARHECTNMKTPIITLVNPPTDTLLVLACFEKNDQSQTIPFSIDRSLNSLNSGQEWSYFSGLIITRR